MNDFRTIATALAPHVAGNTYSLLDATDAVVSVLPNLDATKPAPPVKIPDYVLYRIARGNEDVVEAMRQGKRINAIKALRALFAPEAPGQTSLVGLREAKEACEGQRWDDEFDLYARPEPLADWERDLLHGDPWNPRVSQDPPF